MRPIIVTAYKTRLCKLFNIANGKISSSGHALADSSCDNSPLLSLPTFPASVFGAIIKIPFGVVAY